jgi:hypothetical protein
MNTRYDLVGLCLLIPLLARSQQANVNLGYGALDWATWRHLLYYRFLPNL